MPACVCGYHRASSDPAMLQRCSPSFKNQQRLALRTAGDKHEQVLVQHVQLRAQRRDGLRARRRGDEVEVAPHEEHDVEGPAGYVAHAVALVPHDADDGLDHRQEACGQRRV